MRLLQMSISAGILIAAITLLRSAGRKLFSPRFLYLLWFVALARMILPVELPVKLPDMGIEAAWRDEKPEGPLQILADGAGGDGQAVHDGAMTRQCRRLAVWVWADVCLGLMIYFVCAYIRQARLLNEAVPLEGQAFLEQWKAARPGRPEVRFLAYDRIKSPVTCGVWRPRIILPREMDLENVRSLEHILRHEYVHIKRFDNLWKIVVLAAVCVHWFNPLAWVMWRCFNRDMELACDQRAVEDMDPEGRRAYAMTLLWFAEKNHKVSLLCNGFGKSAVKERIMMLMKQNKRTRIGMICSALVFATSMTVFASTGGSSAGSAAGAGKSPALLLYETPQFEEYQALGLRYDQALDVVSYDSRIVGYFKDEYAPGSINKMDDAAGRICLEAVRDETGKLDYFTEVEKTGFLKSITDQEQRKALARGYVREYGAYGLACDEETGYLTFDGRLVEAIQDTGGCGNYVSGAAKAGDTVGLVVVRDENGAIAEVKAVQPEEISALFQQSIGVHRTESGWRGN